MKEQYRFESSYGKLYKYDEEQNSYMFVSSTTAKTKEEAVEEYEESQNHEDFSYMF